MCSKLAIKTPEHVSDIVLMSLMLTTNYLAPFSSVAEISRCKKPLFTFRKIGSLLVAEVAHCKKLLVTRH